MEQFNITGMSCAACQTRVERAVSKVEGVTECSVSLLTNSMGVSGSASAGKIIRAVEEAGYGANLKNKKGVSANSEYDDVLKDTETSRIMRRFVASLIILIPLLYVSMGSMRFSRPLPVFLYKNYVAIGIYELLLSGIILVINQKFFINGFKGFIHRSPNMDTLVALGSASSFLYSVYALFAMTGAQLLGDAEGVMKYNDELYFESAAMILILITFGKMLESKSKGRTTDAIKRLMSLSAKTVNIVVEGKLKEVSVEQVKVGDRFAVKPGENIPVDGFVVEGSSAVNESALTGESIPVDKKIGDTVSAATLNQSGYLVCEASRVGEDTTLAQIIQMVSDAAATKAPIAKVADKVSSIFVPVVMGISAVTFIVWMIAGRSFGFSLARAISVLVISCPCALGLATPVAIMVGNGMGAKHGIMFKTAVSLEETGKAQIVALDKTGTITKGEPRVTDILAVSGDGERKLVKLALCLEEKSEHPLSKAIVEKAREQGIENDKTLTDFKAEAGNGLSGILDGKLLEGGNILFLQNSIEASGEFGKKAVLLAEELSEQGKTPILFAYDGKLLGLIAVADVIKEDSEQAIAELRDMGIRVVMLTGDNEKTANAIGKKVGVDEVIAGVRPDGKEAVIRKLKEDGKVLMVGDGINDAPALTRADIGIAIGAGTDVAIDAADIVLMKNSLLDVAAAVRLSRATLKNIHQNLFWAFFYNCIGIPLAAGVWIPIFGWTLSPVFGAAAMGLSSFCVVTNALRLNLVKIYAFQNEQMKISQKEKNSMENKTIEITVNGMMCPHCEAHVKEAIEKLDGVIEACAKHDENRVIISTSKDVAESEIKAAVEAAGYEFLTPRSFGD